MILIGDTIEKMKTLEDGSCRCCVTSPPYWGFRDYGVTGQIGREKTPEEYVTKMVDVFREVHRVLADDGTLWLNLGDSYARVGGPGRQGKNGQRSDRRFTATRDTVVMRECTRRPANGIKAKDLIGIPWRVAFALQSDGWYLRSDIIWAKPNPMPESVTDRPTRSHEYIFLMSKSARYYYDAEAIKEPGCLSSIARLNQDVKNQAGSNRIVGKTNGNMKAVGRIDKQRGHSRRHAGFNGRWDAMTREEQCSLMRNKRDVWTVATSKFKGAHFATFPEKLITPCILAGSERGDKVLDPFFGSGTVGVVAQQYGRKFIGIELNPKYVEIAEKRLAGKTIGLGV